MILKAECDVAGMRAAIDFEAIGDAILVEHFVQLFCVDLEPVVITDIDRDRSVAA